MTIGTPSEKNGFKWEKIILRFRALGAFLIPFFSEGVPYQRWQQRVKWEGEEEGKVEGVASS